MEKDELMNVIENLMYEYTDRYRDDFEPYYDGVADGLEMALQEISKLAE